MLPAVAANHTGPDGQDLYLMQIDRLEPARYRSRPGPALTMQRATSVAGEPVWADGPPERGLAVVPAL